MKKQIAIVVAAPITARVFLARQLRALAERYDVTLLVDLRGGSDTLDDLVPYIRIISLPIMRDVQIVRDLQALWLVFHQFRKHRFALVHSVSPKAGLLSSLAGWMARVPVRLHTFTGQVWVTKTGYARRLFKGIDKLIAQLSTTILVDSHSQRDFLVNHGVVEASSALVLGNGSISGVDVRRFHPSSERRDMVRRELAIAQAALVVLFVGRLKVDKGILDLAAAFRKTHRCIPNVVLVIVGPDEEQLQKRIVRDLGEAAAAIRFVPYTKRPEDYMAMADLFVLPSYREGFGSVVIEAAACAVPAIASRIYGLTDAVEEGVTGLLVQPGNAEEIHTAMMRLLENAELRESLGRNALQRARACFSQEVITDAWCALYRRLLSEE